MGYYKEVKTAFKNRMARLDGWANILTGLGFAGRDKQQSAFFTPDREIVVQELDAMYRNDGLIKQIIDKYAQDMTKNGWQIEGDPKGLLQTKLDEINFNFKLTMLIKWARLYGGGIAVLGINDGRPLNEPVNENWIKSVDWLHVFDCYASQILNGVYDPDLNSPNYGMPTQYYVNDIKTAQSFSVHYTRVLRLDWNVIPMRESYVNRGWYDGIIQSIYTDIKNFSTLTKNAATMTNDFVTKILKVEGLSQMLASQGDNGTDMLLGRANALNLTMGTTNTAILDTQEDYQKIQTHFTGYPELFDRFMMIVSAVSKIPVSILFGRSAAGMNATGDLDIKMYHENIHQDQVNKISPALQKLINYILISKDFDSSGIELDNWKIDFNPLDNVSDEEEAIKRHKVAEIDAIYLDRQVLSPEEIRVSRFGDGTWSMNTVIDPTTDLDELKLEDEKAYGDPEEKKAPNEKGD
jgi:phage-related protein (TIGR01555 family)